MPKLSFLVILFPSILLGACGCPKTVLELDPKLRKQSEVQKWDKEGSHADANIYRLGPQRFADPELRTVLQELKLTPLDKWTRIPAGKDDSQESAYQFRSGGIRAMYSEAQSELSVTDTTVEALSPEDLSRNPNWRTSLTERLRKTVPSLAGKFQLINLEQVNRQDSGQEKARPAFMYGRFLRERDGRLVLGTASQFRQGFGKGSSQKHVFYTNFATQDTAKTRIPTRKAILDSLTRLAKRKGALGRMLFPYSPDTLYIEKLIVRNIFKSYVPKADSARREAGYGFDSLLPAITVYAEAKVSDCGARKKERAPLPSPLMIHFNIPCVPGVGQCWPDANLKR